MNTSKPPSESLDLDLRQGLPEALRVLLNEFPRETWEDHPGFDGLIRFWLDRHMMFRRILERIDQEAKARATRVIDPAVQAQSLARLGSAFVGELHGHHNIEDAHYFPVLAGKDQRISAGFELLDKDHHAMDGLLDGFVSRANGLLRAEPSDTSELGRFIDEVAVFSRCLERHLIDEEDLVVPVILKYGAAGLA